MVVYSVLELFMSCTVVVYSVLVVYEEVVVVYSVLELFMRRLYCGSIFCFGVVYEEVVLW